MDEKPCYVFCAVQQESSEFINKYLCDIDPQDVQSAIHNAIKTLDYLFYESISPECSEGARKSRIEAYMYGYPAFLKAIYRDCTSMKNFLLSYSTEDGIILFSKMIYACELIGLMQNYSEMVRSHLLVVTKNSRKKICLKFADTFHWIEAIEQETF